MSAIADSTDPPEASIGLLSDVCDISHSEAIRRLKAHNNDVQRATEEYFEDPSSSKYKWDESAFATDREGETGNNPGLAFTIQGPDELPLSYQNSAAPTRPPSRTDNRSPLGAPTNAAQEDEDLRRALAESAVASGLPPQETGVVDTEPNKYFGPANRTQYDNEQWAMIPTKAAEEVLQPEPAPSNRTRPSGAPAFLRQTRQHRLGALVSIYHKIPLARNILLACGGEARNYGHDSKWWKGSSILTQESMAALSRGEEIWGDAARPNFAHELQRLLAFLEMTNRSYGSVDSLASTPAMDSSSVTWPSDTENAFFMAIKNTSDETPDSDISDLVTVGKYVPLTAAESSDSSNDTDEYADEATTPFIILDIQSGIDGYKEVNTLYDALDHLLWQHALTLEHTFPEDAGMALLVKPAKVITLRLGGDGLTKPCEIPGVFYADRYVPARKDLAIHFQKQAREVKRGLRWLTAQEESRVRCDGKRGCAKYEGLDPVHDVRQCCQMSIDLGQKLIQRQRRDAQWRYYERRWEQGIPYSMTDLGLIHSWTGPYELTPEETADKEQWESIIQTTQDTIDRVNRDLEEYKDTREEYHGCLEVIAKRLTCQEDEVDDELFVFRSNPVSYRPDYWNPTLKYSLRGVALTEELAYVCVREPVAGSSAGPDSDQWWKIGFEASDLTSSSPAKTERVTLDEVLHAAGTGAKNPILVYATEEAMQAVPTPLSDALCRFVKADNRSFQQELAQEQTRNDEMDWQDQKSRGAQASFAAPSAVTAANLSQIAGKDATTVKRKYSTGSSVATRGSLRSDLAEISLDMSDPKGTEYDEAAFSDPRGIFDDATSMSFHHEEFAGASQMGPQQPSGVVGDGDYDMQEMQEMVPEMQEQRASGISPFLSQAVDPSKQKSSGATPDHNSGNSEDHMDLDAG
ncbi:hypothetical protein GGR56DRAFT_654778 [Xylariaceae sp. FL0804]|nr:hypothetical protein GGR56DRAFT_654778 [Xylariaceae sp. FL0804]